MAVDLNKNVTAGNLQDVLGNVGEYLDDKIDTISDNTIGLVDKVIIEGLPLRYWKTQYVNNGKITISANWETFIIYPYFDDFTFTAYANSFQTVVFYSTIVPMDSGFISGIRPASNYGSVTVRRSDVPDGTKSIMLCNRKASGEPSFNGSYQRLVKDITEAQLRTESIDNPAIIMRNIDCSNDFVVIKDEVWTGILSSDRITLTINRYKNEFGNLCLIDSITTDFGHWNAVSYNEIIDALIFSNSANSVTTEGNEVYIVNNPRALVNGATLSNSAIKIEIPSSYGYKIQAVFGENNFGFNNIVYLVTSDMKNVYKIMLNKASDGSFDGTFVELENHVLPDGPAFDKQTGGIAYKNGKIYLGSNEGYDIFIIDTTTFNVSIINTKKYKTTGDQYVGTVQGVDITANRFWANYNSDANPNNVLVNYPI